MIRNKQHLTYIINQDSVKIKYRSQVVVFNSFDCVSHHKFKKFRNVIANSPKDRYDNLNDVFRLANSYQVRSCAGHSFIIHKNIAY